MDYSSYEGANLVHDLNIPISNSLYNSFDVVIDGGTLEHVFNFPVAIENMLRLVKQGGMVLMCTPANNLCGHGFYQFSPELMFRVFSPENGFKLLDMLFVKARFPSVEIAPALSVYRVSDPAQINKRVLLCNSHPVIMIIRAIKTESKTIYNLSPQQSDYIKNWDSSQKKGKSSKNRWWKKPLKAIFGGYAAYRKGFRERKRFSLNNKEFYRPLPNK
jgi:hypothetical protein